MVFCPFAAGYFLSFFFRNVNAVISKDLAGEFELSPSDLGFLTSMYLLAFAAFQLPLGVLLDRFGPRRTQTVLMALTGVGALIFAASGGLWGLSAGRALIGIGCADLHHVDGSSSAGPTTKPHGVKIPVMKVIAMACAERSGQIVGPGCRCRESGSASSTVVSSTSLLWVLMPVTTGRSGVRSQRA